MKNGDLISRKALEQMLLERSFYPAIVKSALEAAPAVDAIPVVRCKDCKHFTAGYCCRDIKGRSQMHYTGEDAFCFYGERRNDGKD